MYTCKGCGGYLKFDIEAQALKCESCDTKYPVPEEKDQNMDAEYTAKIYTCPQCGGELMGDENEAVVFCSFCGSSNVLQERYQKEKRPAKIIPFKISKEECKEIYKDKLKKSPFAPAALKNPKYIESFRGIYMPFYLYNAEVDDQLSVPGETVESSGSYDIHTEYRFTGHVSGSVSGLPHDASASFADDISESIVPFGQDQAVDFATGYMSGFYADTADVDDSLYLSEIQSIAREGVARQVIDKAKIGHISMEDKMEMQIHPKFAGSEIGLFPVWFLSFRNKDRIAYAAINGQTGKMALDVPVDMKKFFLFTLGMAVPIFVILNFLLTLQPWIMMIVSGVFALVSVILAIVTQADLSDALSGANDKGLGAMKSKQKKKTVVPFILLPILSIIGVAGVFFMDPVSDIPYYGASICCIAAVVITMCALVKVYNTISTRPLPQFKRRGGDDNA